MFDAQLLVSKLETHVRVYSPWMPRVSDNARFTMDVVWMFSGTLKVEIFHKNSEDTGDGQLTDGSMSRTTIGRTTGEWTGLKELVRYRFTITPTLIGTPARVLFRTLQPCWFDTVSA